MYELVLNKPVMSELFRLLVIGAFALTISIFNILDKYANVFMGLMVGIATIIFLIFQIIKIRKDIQLRNIELCEKRMKQQLEKEKTDKDS